MSGLIVAWVGFGLMCLLCVLFVYATYKQSTPRPLTIREIEKYHHTIISSETAEELENQRAVLTVDVLNPSGRIVRLRLVNGKSIIYKVKDY